MYVSDIGKVQVEHELREAEGRLGKLLIPGAHDYVELFKHYLGNVCEGVPPQLQLPTEMTSHAVLDLLLGPPVRLEDGSYVSPCTLLVVPGQVKASLLEVEPFKATLATYIYDLAKEATRAAEDLQRALMATSSALPVGRPFEEVYLRFNRWNTEVGRLVLEFRGRSADALWLGELQHINAIVQADKLRMRMMRAANEVTPADIIRLSRLRRNPRALTATRREPPSA